MSMPEDVAVTREPPLAREWLRALQYHLGGRRGLLALAGFAVVFGIGANWSWLVAAGIAPLLISVLPCVAMCALGLCMSRAMGGSCAGKKGAADDVAAQGAQPEAVASSPAAPGGVARTQTTEEEKIHA